MLIHDTMTYLSRARQDDIESIKYTVKAAYTYLDGTGIDKSTYNDTEGAYSFLKSMFKKPFSHKTYPRSLLSKCARSTYVSFPLLTIEA